MSSSSIEIAQPSHGQLVRFALTISAAFAVLAAIRVWRRGVDEVAITGLIVAALFLLSAFVSPASVAFVYRGWMRFAEVLGWINTRVLLILIFYLVVTPIGLVMRLFHRSPLPGGHWTEPPRSSYGDRHYEKQF